MKIRRIAVKKLFGVFNHVIQLNEKDHITIIHGPNGFGKTVLLTMLNAVFNLDYPLLKRTPFIDFTLDFTDRSTLRIVRDTNISIRRGDTNGIDAKLIFNYKTKTKKTQKYIVKSLNERDLPFSLNILEREIRGLERIGYDTWRYRLTGEKLNMEEVLSRFRGQLHLPLFERSTPKWLTDIKDGISIRFIEAQRLLTYPASSRHPEYEGKRSMVPAVMNYSELLAQVIQEKLAEYASLSQSLDRSFPTRLVKGSSSTQTTISNLRKNLKELENKRQRLIVAGLLEKEKEQDLGELKNIDKSKINVLSVYVEDVKRKLQVLDDLSNKIDLLVKIINNRFLYKQLSINKKDGFIFHTPDGKTLSAQSLSSGEQHELVLLYQLLFMVKPESLILIDEPELSLHVAWQQQFLKDLQEITKLAGFDFLIATHSPQIIHDRWDLTVELKGPSK